MLQLKNSTPFPASLFVFPDVQGIDTLFVAVKSTFVIGGKIVVAPEQAEVCVADQFWGEPGASSLKYASEAHPTKPSTDVVLIGKAQAPDRRPAVALDVTLAVAGRSKTVRVFGDRQWSGGFLPPLYSAPLPFEMMPLVYEHAYGGAQEEDSGGKALFEPRNPVGRGFAGKRGRAELKGLPLPNLEDPSRLLSEPGQRSLPSCFGFVASSWEPRRSFAGTYDERWMTHRAPYLPEDFSPRFFNAAPPDLVWDRYLEGGEAVEVRNASPRGPLKFVLPACPVSASMHVSGRRENPPLNLETVIIEPDRDCFSLLWRGAVPCDKSALRIERAEITMKSGNATRAVLS